jgi:hypothetical protein
MAIVTFILGSSQELPVEFSIVIDDVDVTTEEFANSCWSAAHRTRWIDDDLPNLERAYQKRVRRLIEQFQAPSMSVGDSITVDLDGGLRRRQFTVAEVGSWVVTDSDQWPSR